MTYNQQQQPPPREQRYCKYCSTGERRTPIKFKKEVDGKWTVLNMDNTPHDRPYCDNMKAGAKMTTGIIVKTPPPPETGTGALDPQLNSIKFEIVEVSKAIMELKTILFELRKGAQTNATVIDSLAQKIELIIAKTGYPGPEKIGQESEAHRQLVEIKEKILEPYPKQIEEAAASGDVLQKKPNQVESLLKKEMLWGDEETLTPGQQKEYDSKFEHLRDVVVKQQELQQQQPQKEDVVIAKKKDKIIDKIVDKVEQVMDDEVPTTTITKEEDPEKAAQIFTDKVLPAIEKTSQGKPWDQISEPFLCDSCKTKTHNGYEKYSTKLCPGCHQEHIINVAVKKQKEIEAEYYPPPDDVELDF